MWVGTDRGLAVASFPTDTGSAAPRRAIASEPFRGAATRIDAGREGILPGTLCLESSRPSDGESELGRCNATILGRKGTEAGRHRSGAAHYVSIAFAKRRSVKYFSGNEPTSFDQSAVDTLAGVADPRSGTMIVGPGGGSDLAPTPAVVSRNSWKPSVGGSQPVRRRRKSDGRITRAEWHKELGETGVIGHGALYLPLVSG